MRLGEFVADPTPWNDLAGQIQVVERPIGSDLHAMALRWLKEDRQHRRELERNGRKLRGARRDEVWNVFAFVPPPLASFFLLPFFAANIYLMMAHVLFRLSLILKRFTRSRSTVFVVRLVGH